MDNDPTRSFLALANGTEIAQYQIVNRIGAGGMGEVYLAHDRSLNRKVALKFLSPTLCSDEDCRTRFKNEAQAAARLNHPNIVTIHEVSEYNGRPFFAMEVVEGQSLKDFIANEKPDIDRMVKLAMQICDGLKAAHELGIVHRDIKPSNILIDTRGRARIVDFGLATVKGIEGITRAGSTAGTPAYMSPEQVRGEKVGPTSDLFSLGVVLYQMFAGKLPFSGDYEAAVVYAITNDDPTPVRKHNPDIPDAIEAIIFNLLEKDPSKRYQSADEVLAALESLGVERVAVVTSARKRLWLRLGALVVILAAAGITAQLVWSPIKRNAPAKKTIAVMPFENLGAPEDDYFADGQTDAIIMELSKFGELGVISRTSSMLYKDSDKNPQEIGEELGATYLLTGTILWEKSEAFNEVRINVFLVRTSDGSQVWAKPYERVLDKVFILQSEIAENVTAALRVAIGSAERYHLTRAPTDDLQAYDYFLRGNEYFNRSWEQEDIQAALELFQKAVNLDPDYAAAYAMLSRCHASMYWEYYDRTDERREKAIQAAQKSLELEPDLIEGHLAMGYCHYQCGRDYQHALKEFERGLELQPNNSDLYNAVACIQRRKNDFESSARNFAMALKLDPRSHLKAWDAGLTYSMLRDYEQADKYLSLSASLAPNFALAYIYRAWQQVLRGANVEGARQIVKEATGKADLNRSKFYWWLERVIEDDYRKVMNNMNPGSDTAAYYLQRAQFYRLLGEPELMRCNADTARMILERKLSVKSDDAGFHSSLGMAYAYLGENEEASLHAEQALSLLPVSRDAFDAPFLMVNYAEILVMRGDYASAVHQLKILMSIPGFVSSSYLKLDPLWEPLHGRPDFDSLLTEST